MWMEEDYWAGKELTSLESRDQPLKSILTKTLSGLEAIWRGAKNVGEMVLV